MWPPLDAGPVAQVERNGSLRTSARLGLVEVGRGDVQVQDARNVDVEQGGFAGWDQCRLEQDDQATGRRPRPPLTGQLIDDADKLVSARTGRTNVIVATLSERVQRDRSALVTATRASLTRPLDRRRRSPRRRADPGSAMPTKRASRGSLTRL